MSQFITDLRQAAEALSTLQPAMLAEMQRVRDEDPNSPLLESLTYIAISYEEALNASARYVAEVQFEGEARVLN